MRIALWRQKPAEETVDAEPSLAGADPERPARPRQAWRAVLPALVFLFVALMFAAHYLGGKHREAESEYGSLIDELRVRSQQVPREARDALLGQAKAFARLKRYRDEMQAVLDRLRRGDMASGLPPLPANVEPQLRELEASWGVVRDDVETMLANQREAVALRESGKSLESLVSSARLTMQEVYGAMSAGEAGVEQIALAGRQLLRLERMSDAIGRVLEGRAESESAVERLRAEAAEVVESTRRLLGAGAADGTAAGDAVVRQGLTRLDNLFANRARLIEEFVDRSGSYASLRGAASALDANSESFLQATRALGDGYRRASVSHRDYTTAVVGFAALALGCLLLLGMQLLRDARARAEEARRREQESRERNRRNQDAILKLLDEMSELAEGDLTAYASVTEDVTGAIADAFNYAIDALKEMVSRINHTSVRVADAAQSTRTRATQLSVASDKQNAEIVKATAAIEEMARSIEQVSASSRESSDVANGAVATANKGATAVRETMSGMDDIRETIQETSKRLKRLGESSQEVGHMVGLIDDIADQTNVLALNAAIQASMAGESGRGFAVVADEVQRLAERAGQATKRIETLVGTIQADTNEAIASMEKSTAGVVDGARLARGAGDALGEIEQVSQHLAGLIETISAASAAQATRAAAVAKTMSAIRHIAAQTRTGANTTAKSVGNLVQLAEALKTSVAGFRLPESAEATVVDLHAGAPRKSAEGGAENARSSDVHLLRG